MRLIIKNLALMSHRFDIDGVDIVTAIEYYGITELLDTIGEEQLKSHLEYLQSDKLKNA